MNSALPFLTDFSLALVFKVLLLILLAVFMLFAFFLFNYIAALKKIVIIRDVAGTTLVQTLAIIYVVAAIFLFILALVIL